MAKTYPLKALWPLLPFEVAPAPLQATLDAYGGGLVKYAVSQDGIWLYSLAQPLNAVESENLTGFHPADLVPKQIDGVEGYFYALLGGAPLLPIPFTADQLIAFNERTAGLIASCIERGSETDEWITDLEKDNSDAAELARGIHGGKWPLDLADFMDTKIDGAAKPRFRLADGIQLNDSAKALKSAFNEAQHQKVLLKQLGITPDLMKQIDYQKDMEKMLSINLGSAADAVYQQELKRNQDMLRSAIGPSASATAADTIGRQFASTLGLDAVGNAATADLLSQSTVQAEIEKALGGGLGTVADAYRQAQYPQQSELEKFKAMVGGNVADSLGQLDRAGLDAALGRYHPQTASEVYAQIERERIEQAMAPPEPSERVIEFTLLPIYDHQAAEKRRLDREREHRLETERQAVFVRLEAEQEFANRKQAAIPETPAPEVKPVQRGAAQDAAILAMLQTMGIDPLAVPKNSPGKAGTKAEVRAALDSNPLFTGATVFEKAWERLTNRGEIVIRA